MAKDNLTNSLVKYHPLILTALVVVCYSNTLGCGLVFDDLAAVRDNKDIRPHTPITNIFFNDFWGTPLKKEQSHKSYRPLTVLTFRLNYAVHGLHPLGYHLINILLHALVTVLFYKLCLHFLSEMSSLVSSALFAVHPIHTEAVAGVVGRAELLSAAVFLGALLFYMKSKFQAKGKVWQQCSVTSLLAILGVLCKEQALTVLAVCCVYEFAARKNPSKDEQSVRCMMLGRGAATLWIRDSVLKVVFLAIVSAVTLWLRYQIMGPNLPVFSRFDNPAAVAETPVRQLTYNYLLSVNAWLLLFPFSLCCDWTMSTIPLVTDLWDVRNLATLALYLSIFWIVRNIIRSEDESKHTIIMSLTLMVIPFLPASNLFFPVGFVIAERVLYIPSMGFCMLVAHGWHRLWRKKSVKKLIALAMIVLLGMLAIRTIKRNMDWKSEFSLYNSALEINQNNSKLFNNMGQVFEGMNNQDDALKQYEIAIKLQPDDIRGYLNVGRILTNLRKFQEAEDVYLKAKKLLPQTKSETDKEVYVPSSHLQLFLSLAFLISQNDSRLEEADALYRQVINLRSDFTNAYLSRGDVLLKMNRTKEAEEMYHRALQFDDTNPDLYFNLGVVLMDQGRNTEALDIFNKALDIDPDHEKSLVYSAVLIQETGMSNFKTLARYRLEKIVDQGKENERVYINLGLMALENKDLRSAERWFKKVLVVTPTSRGALFNLGLLLSEQQRYAESLPFLTELLKNHPNHINGLILMADVKVNSQRDFDAAEECYRQVLKVEPNNVKGMHNLCVVYVERQDFANAERCFFHAASVHPQVDYIQKHLEVVRGFVPKDDSEYDPESDPSFSNHFSTTPTIS